MNRLSRPTCRVLTLTALPVALAALVSCSPPVADDVDVTSLGIDRSAQLDPATGAVVLPYDRLAADFYETDRLATGAAAAVSRCAAGSGVSFDPPPLTDDPIYASEHYFGPWTTEQASRFGFVAPMSLRDLAANDIEGAPDPGETAEAPEDELGDDAWTVIDDCNRNDAQVTMLLDATRLSEPWDAELAAVHDALLDDVQADDLVTELEACYETAGLTPSEEMPWFPEGSDGRRIAQGQIAMALSVVECKESIDFTRRMADIEARLQEPVLRTHAPELAEQRRELDEALSVASALLDESTR